jgi:hypothetical protein
MTVHYEWVVEQMDDIGDILETSGWDTLLEAKKFAASCELPLVICLRRDVGNSIDGLTDRQYAYPGDGQFEFGATIPKRFLDDFNLLDKS